MNKILAACAALAALVVVGGASADPLRYGVADDWPKFHDCGDVFWTSSSDIGYQDLRVTLQWTGGAQNAADPAVKRAVDCAIAQNVRPIIAIYPSKPSAIGSDGGAQDAFAAFTGAVASAFPQVKNFIVGNEPNVNRFWQPQYAGGQDAAATDYEHTLAKSYDAIKGARPDASVWGPAISSRGNDNANAASNPSHSPVWFIKYMGDAYRASGRTKPIFDEFNMHPYPPTQDTDPFSKPFQWPQAGAANLDRIKQAIWDAFNGTGQPVVTEQPGGSIAKFAAPQSLPIDLDEVGEQTVVTGHEAAYVNPPESISPISEDQQARNHTELMEMAACDPAVKALLFFPLIDENNIHDGFQSGNLFADFAKKLSYAAVKGKIASARGLCQGGVAGVPQGWQHTTQVIGAQGIFGGPGTDVGSQPSAKPAGIKVLWSSFTVSEDATYTATVTKAGGGAVATLTGLAKAYYKPGLKFPLKKLAAGSYQFQVVLKAATNPSRTTTLTSSTFTVGKAAPAKGKPKPTKKPKPSKKPKPPKKQK